jgi:hypothetical protein
MITTTITSPKQNQTTKQTNKQTLVHFPNKENYFSRNFPGDMFGKERGLGGQVTATHVPKDI